MTDWTAGYVADIGYTYGYYGEMNPLRMQLAFANAGLRSPQVATACELGFGQGVSANLHAAATAVEWHGTDFNPSQAAFARELAAVSGARATLRDDAFTEFAQRRDLPDFDFIAMHGIWSWINDHNRRCIVDFVRRKLKVGGVLYISYNTLPGWAGFAPMRHLLRRHAEVMGVEGSGLPRRIDDALGFADRLLATQPLFVRNNPQIAERLAFLKDQNRSYLAHEFFNRDWHPMHFSTMVEWLEPAKLSFACSAHFADHMDALNLTEPQQALLREIADPSFRESVRDFMTNQQFRRDYWVKGLRRLSDAQQADAMLDMPLVLVMPRTEPTPLKVKGALGEAEMNEQTCAALFQAMADHQPRTLRQLQAASGLPLPKVVLSALMLIANGHFAPVQDEAAAAAARPATDRLNAYLVDPERGAGEVGTLVSPLLGGGIALHRFAQLFLASRARGRQRPEQWVQDAWALISGQKQRLQKDGKPIDGAEGNLAELRRLAAVFVEKELPALQALQIA